MKESSLANGGAALTRFERPRSVAEAAGLLASGDWTLLAGGTDLYPAHVGRNVTRPVLDLSQVAGLRGIRRSDSGWTIGATTTWSDVIRADLPPLFDALKAAAREVGGVQIQNAGTVVGNVCNASPAADGMPALLALGAEVELQSATGSRRLPLEDFVLGSRRTARRETELVSALHVPARADGARSVFRKLGGRRYLVISITMVAVMIEPRSDGSVVRAGVAVGSCSAVAKRLPALEARLLGRHAAGLAACIEPADLAPLTPIDDIRASGDYRRDATLTLLRRALEEFAP
jgi:CO/xanthine dehydrogenase FAD-binding subunit